MRRRTFILPNGIEEILTELELVFPIRAHVTLGEIEQADRGQIIEKLAAAARAAYEAKEEEVGSDLMRVIETQYIMLPLIDRLWVDHLHVMDALKTGIGLRGYGQKDPRVEYEKEAYEIFEDLKHTIADEATKAIFRVVIQRQDDLEANDLVTLPGVEASQEAPASIFEPLPSGALIPQPARVHAAVERALGPVPGSEGRRHLHTNKEDEENLGVRAAGRNDLCPCGSGKKYKKCHGATP